MIGAVHWRERCTAGVDNLEIHNGGEMKQKKKIILLLLMALLVTGYTTVAEAKNPTLSSRQYLMKTGGTHTLRLEGGKAVRWSTSDESVVTVKNGKIKAKGIGTARITCLANDKKIYTCYVRVVEKKRNDTQETYKVAHRGYSKEAPENTMTAFRQAVENGYQYIECDIQFTRDGVPVVLHDAKVDRTSNGSGRADSYTYAQLRKLDAGSWKSSEYAGEKIPSLQELMKFCVKKNVTPYIELKNGSRLTRDKLREVYRVIKGSGMQKRVIWFSFNYNYISWVKEIDPTAQIGYVPKGNVTRSVVSMAENLKTGKNRVFLCVNLKKISTKMVELCKESGIDLTARRVGSKKKFNRLDSYYMSAIGNAF